MRKRDRGREKEKRVAQRLHPRSIHLHIRHIRIIHRGIVGRQRQLPAKNITIVNAVTVHHFNVPRPVERTSHQTLERLIWMIELGARRHIGRVENRIGTIAYTLRMGIDRTINQTSGARSVRISMRAIIRPTIIPSCARSIVWSRFITWMAIIRIIVGDAKVGPVIDIIPILPSAGIGRDRRTARRC